MKKIFHAFLISKNKIKRKINRKIAQLYKDLYKNSELKFPIALSMKLLGKSIQALK